MTVTSHWNWDTLVSDSSRWGWAFTENQNLGGKEEVHVGTKTLEAPDAS